MLSLTCAPQIPSGGDHYQAAVGCVVVHACSSCVLRSGPHSSGTFPMHAVVPLRWQERELNTPPIKHSRFRCIAHLFRVSVHMRRLQYILYVYAMVGVELFHDVPTTEEVRGGMGPCWMGDCLAITPPVWFACRITTGPLCDFRNVSRRLASLVSNADHIQLVQPMSAPTCFVLLTLCRVLAASRRPC